MPFPSSGLLPVLVPLFSLRSSITPSGKLFLISPMRSHRGTTDSQSAMCVSFSALATGNHLGISLHIMWFRFTVKSKHRKNLPWTLGHCKVLGSKWEAFGLLRWPWSRRKGLCGSLFTSGVKFSGFEPFLIHFAVWLQARVLNLSWHQFPFLKRGLVELLW